MHRRTAFALASQYLATPGVFYLFLIRMLHLYLVVLGFSVVFGKRVQADG